MIASILLLGMAMGSWLPVGQATTGQQTSTAVPSAQAPTKQKPVKKRKTYDGDWWLAAEKEERSGLLEGAGDCLTWTAHTLEFTETSSQVEPRITSYYQSYPAQRRLLFIDVWKKTEPKATEVKAAPAAGEDWKNAHWYLNGTWWKQSREDERLGFIEGHLWCMRSRVNQPSESYSRPAEYYVEKISEYVKKNGAYEKAIADILKRYRDPGLKTPVHNN
jgi:hypothetical protein